MKNSWTGGEIVPARRIKAGELAVAVHRCEPGAFERLIDRFERPLFTYAHGILQNAFDAQEVVQDAMMRAHRALTRQYDEARCAALALRPWLFRTVRNLCLNKRRSKRSALEEPLESFDDGPHRTVRQSAKVRSWSGRRKSSCCGGPWRCCRSTRAS